MPSLFLEGLQYIQPNVHLSANLWVGEYIRANNPYHLSQ